MSSFIREPLIPILKHYIILSSEHLSLNSPLSYLTLAVVIAFGLEA